MTDTVCIFLPSTITPVIFVSADLTDDQMDMECFRNVYKDDTGCNPRGYTLEQARAYMANRVPPTREEMDEDERRYQEEKAAYEAEEAAYYAEQQQKREDFDFFPWQLQAGKLRNLPEAMILEY